MTSNFASFCYDSEKKEAFKTIFIGFIIGNAYSVRARATGDEVLTSTGAVIQHPGKWVFPNGITAIANTLLPEDRRFEWLQGHREGMTKENYFIFFYFIGCCFIFRGTGYFFLRKVHHQAWLEQLY